jgi:hypothetical protein
MLSEDGYSYVETSAAALTAGVCDTFLLADANIDIYSHERVKLDVLRRFCSVHDKHLTDGAESIVSQCRLSYGDFTMLRSADTTDTLGKYSTREREMSTLSFVQDRYSGALKQANRRIKAIKAAIEQVRLVGLAPQDFIECEGVMRNIAHAIREKMPSDRVPRPLPVTPPPVDKGTPSKKRSTTPPPVDKGTPSKKLSTTPPPVDKGTPSKKRSTTPPPTDKGTPSKKRCTTPPPTDGGEKRATPPSNKANTTTLMLKHHNYLFGLLVRSGASLSTVTVRARVGDVVDFVIGSLEGIGHECSGAIKLVDKLTKMYITVCLHRRVQKTLLTSEPEISTPALARAVFEDLMEHPDVEELSMLTQNQIKHKINNNALRETCPQSKER